MKTIPHIMYSNIITAMRSKSVGTQVLGEFRGDFMHLLDEQVKRFDFSKCRPTPGQGFLILPEKVHNWVSAGVGPRSENPDHYLIREHRGVPQMFLKREYAAKPHKVAAIVYTHEAYAADPQVSRKEAERTSRSSHVLVAVLSWAGPEAPLSPYRFVANLGGGNNDALKWGADEIRQMASEIIDYDSKWCVVAD